MRISDWSSDVCSSDLRQCRFVWLGTKQTFDAFTFAFVQTEHGWFQAHAYQFEPGMSTFIVETLDETWHAAGLDTMSQERSEERRVGNECVSQCRSRWPPSH